MKQNLLATVLIVALALSGLWAAFLVLQYNRYHRRAGELQARLNEITNTRNVVQSLANDAVAYSRRNPALVPLLQQFGLIPQQNPAPAAAPVSPAPAPAPASKTATTKK